MVGSHSFSLGRVRLPQAGSVQSLRNSVKHQLWERLLRRQLSNRRCIQTWPGRAGQARVSRELDRVGVGKEWRNISARALFVEGKRRDM